MAKLDICHLNIRVAFKSDPGMIKTWMGLIVEDLKASYEQHHPDKLKFFYRLVMDIGDYKTQELTLDEVWEFEKKMHMPEEKGDLAIKKFCKKMRVFKIMLRSKLFT